MGKCHCSVCDPGYDPIVTIPIDPEVALKNHQETLFSKMNREQRRKANRQRRKEVRQHGK